MNFNGTGSVIRAVQMSVAGDLDTTDLPETLLDASRYGLGAFLSRSPLNAPEDRRLAFRELGLSIGLRAVDRMRQVLADEPAFNGGTLPRRVASLADYAPVGRVIENYWRNPARQARASWQAHCDINMVMLATSLAPDEFLSL